MGHGASMFVAKAGAKAGPEVVTHEWDEWWDEVVTHEWGEWKFESYAKLPDGSWASWRWYWKLAAED